MAAHADAQTTLWTCRTRDVVLMTEVKPLSEPAARVVARYEALAAAFDGQADRYRASADLLRLGLTNPKDIARALTALDAIARALSEVGHLALEAAADEVDLRLAMATHPVATEWE